MHGEAPPAYVTYLFLGLLAATVAALALEEKLHAKKSMITGLFAMVCLLPPPTAKSPGFGESKKATILPRRVSFPGKDTGILLGYAYRSNIQPQPDRC